MNRSLTKGQAWILAATAVPMIATGVAGAVATYTNMDRVLHSSATSLGLVAAGEGATLVAALVMLSLTMLGQSTPVAVRAGLWLMPMLAAGTGAMVATSHRDALIMAVTPMAMTVSAEGLGLVCRRVVAFSTGAERSNGEFLWQANRAKNARWSITRSRAERAVWRNVRDTTASDGELGAKIDRVRRDAVTAAVQGELSQVLGTPVAPAVAADVAESVAALPVRTPGATLAEFPTATAVAPDDTDAEMDQAVAIGNSHRGTVAPTPVAATSVTPLRVASLVKTVTEDDTVGDLTVPDSLEAATVLGIIEYMTAADVATAKGVAAATVRSWKARGRITPVGQDAGGRDLYHPAHIAALPDRG